MANGLQIQWSTMSVYGSMPFDERLRDLVSHQENAQAEAKAAHLIKTAKFKYNTEYDEIYVNPDRGFNQSLKLELATLNFVHKCTNIMVLGSTGSGKSTLICGLGRLCCTMGISTRYFNAKDLLDELHAADYTAKRSLRNKLRKTKILILDDLGLQPLNTELSMELFSILEDRINSGVTILGTQLSEHGIARAMNCNKATIDANMRRLTQGAIKIELRGDIRRMTSKGSLPKDEGADDSSKKGAADES